MITAKKTVQQILEGLPDDATIEDIQYRIYVRQKIENSLEDIHHGRTYSSEEVEAMSEKWLEELDGPRPQ
jgi:hypothetical protein